MNNPLVSVIMPAFNCAEFVGQAINSILAQEYKQVEIIVVDDGSTDETPGIALEYGAPVRLLRQERQGPSAARNAGISASRGKLVAFLDADDLWKPDKLAYQVPLFDDPETGMAYCNFDYIDENDGLIRTRLGRWYRGGIFTPMMKYGLAWTGTVVARKEIFEKTGLFDERMPTAEDWDMWVRISALCKVDYDIHTLASYRMRSGSLLGGIEFIEWMIYSLNKNFETYGRLAGMSYREYRRLLAHYYYRLGNGSLPASISRRHRAYLWRAIRTYPFHFKALRAYFWGLCAYWRGRKSEAIGLDYLNR